MNQEEALIIAFYKQISLEDLRAMGRTERRVLMDELKEWFKTESKKKMLGAYPLDFWLEVGKGGYTKEYLSQLKMDAVNNQEYAKSARFRDFERMFEEFGDSIIYKRYILTEKFNSGKSLLF